MTSEIADCEVIEFNSWRDAGPGACAIYQAWGGEDERPGHIPRPPLLYVGITNSPKIRLDAHRRQSAWSRDCRKIWITWYRGRTLAETAETQLIRAYHPVFNVRDNVCRCGNTCPACLYSWVYHAAQRVYAHRCPSTLWSDPGEGIRLVYLGEDADWRYSSSSGSGSAT